MSLPKPLLWAAGPAGAAALGYSVWTSTERLRTEQPRYDVLSSREGVEVRRYAPTIVAVTEVHGSWDKARNRAFWRLARYIFGANSGKQRLEMTSPVEHTAGGEQIAMTSPVTTQPVGQCLRMAFTMPSAYSLETLPTPLDEQVRLERVPRRTVAALRFSGRATRRRIDRKKAECLAKLERYGLPVMGEAVLAQYDAPWALPFLRRNEVLVPVLAS